MQSRPQSSLPTDCCVQEGSGPALETEGWPLGRQCGPTLPLRGGAGWPGLGPRAAKTSALPPWPCPEQQRPSGDPESGRWAFQRRGPVLRGGQGQQEPSRAEWPGLKTPLPVIPLWPLSQIPGQARSTYGSGSSSSSGSGSWFQFWLLVPAWAPAPAPSSRFRLWLPVPVPAPGSGSMQQGQPNTLGSHQRLCGHCPGQLCTQGSWSQPSYRGPGVGQSPRSG